MSDNRETPASRAAETPEGATNPGAPVEETEASQTEVLQAVQRSRSTSDSESTETVRDEVNGAKPGTTTDASAGSPADSTTQTDDSVVDASVAEAPGSSIDSTERARREKLASVDTELDMTQTQTESRASTPMTTLDELPSASAEPAAPATPARDGEIRISSDHPMAAFYVQTPMPPEIKGNRGAGSLIAVLATLGFALVFAGVLALWLAPTLAPSQFVDGILGNIVSWGFIAATVAFLVGMIVLVLIFGRAGWWAYVLGGFLVGVLVWLAATAGVAADAEGVRVLFETSPIDLITSFGVTLPAIAAGLVAREATVWFGAWVGSRGRRMRARNAVALAEYETALAEAQAKQA